MKKAKSLFKVISLFVTCLVMILSFFTLPNFFGEVHAIDATEKITVTYKIDDASITFADEKIITDATTNGMSYKTRYVELSGVSFDSSYSNYYLDADATKRTFPKKTKVVDGRTYDMLLTGWKLVSATTSSGTTYDTFVAPKDENYANPEDVQKDIGTVYAKHGQYNVPYQVSSIVLEAVYGRAIYVRSPYDRMFYDDTHLFIMGSNIDENGNYVDYKVEITTDSNGNKTNNYDSLEGKKSLDTCYGTLPKLTYNGTTLVDGPVSTLTRAYELITNDANSTMFDNIIVLCGDLYEVYLNYDATSKTGAKPETMMNYLITNKDSNGDFILNNNKVSILNYFGSTNDTKKPATITSMDDYKFDFILNAPRYDIHNYSSLRLDNLNFRNLRAGVVSNTKVPTQDRSKTDILMPVGTTAYNTTYVRGKQFNFRRNTEFVTTETVTSAEQTQIRFGQDNSSGDQNSVKYFRLFGGRWDIVSTHSSVFGYFYNSTTKKTEAHKYTALRKDMHITVGGNVICERIVNGFTVNSTLNSDGTTAEFSMLNPPTINVLGGRIKKIFGTGIVFGSHVEGDVNINIAAGYIGELYGAGNGSVKKYTASSYNGQSSDYTAGEGGNVNVKVYSGSFDLIFGAGKFFTSNVEGNVNLNLSNIKVYQTYKNEKQNALDKIAQRYYGNVYGGGMGGSTTGIVNLNIEGDSVIEGNIYGAGLGLTDTITKPLVYFLDNKKISDGESAAWTNALNAYHSKNGVDDNDWYTKPTNFPKYDENTNIISARIYHDASRSDFFSLKKWEIQTMLSLAPVGGVNLYISDSIVNGIVYGGGSICETKGDIIITISNSNINQLYGAGDGISTPDKVTLYSPLEGDYSGLAMPKSGTVSDGANVLSKEFIWSSDINIKTVGGIYDGKNDCIYPNGVKTSINDDSLSSEIKAALAILNSESNPNKDAQLVYSENMNKLGQVNGNVTVIVDGKNTSINTLFGGANKGLTNGFINVDINSGDIGTVYGGSNQANVDGANTDGDSIDISISGENTSIDKLYGANNAAGEIAGDVNLIVENGTITTIFGGGDRASLEGNATVIITGGNIHTIYGGGNQASVGSTNVTMKDLDTADSNEVGAWYLYGGGNLGAVNGNIEVNVIDADIFGTNASNMGTLYGGCNNANVGGNITVNVSGSTSFIYLLVGGNNAGGDVTGTIDVNIENGQLKTVFGGGNLVDYAGTSTITVDAGTIGNLFGGGNAGSVTNTNIRFNNGTVTGHLYGGGYSGDVDVATIIIENVNTIKGVYGGGQEGNINTSTTVTIKAGTYQYIYGGGKNGAVTGTATTNIIGGTVTRLPEDPEGIGNVYGGGEGANATTQTTDLSISGSTVVEGSVYGGGNAGAVGTTNITFDGGKVSGDVYGGGYGETATSGNTNVTYTGTITVKGNVYGGGNAGKVTGTASTNVTTLMLKNESLRGNIYGGGKEAAVNNVSLTIAYAMAKDVNGGGQNGKVTGTASTIITTGDFTGNVFGAGEGEDAVTNSSSLTINGGTIAGNIYGGGDAGEVTGTATTIINGGTVTNNVYGGGNNAHVENVNLTVNGGSMNDVNGGGRNGTTGTATTTIKGGTITNNVYGGGEGTTASTEETNLTIDTTGTIGGNVFGGGDAGATTTSKVTLNKGEIETLYGGGNVATVGTSTAIVNGGTINTNVFGGGYGATANTTNSNLIITNGAILGSAYGGGQLGGGTTTNVTISGGTIGGIENEGNAFGGGKEAAVTHDSHITVTGGTILGNLYGAGEGESAVVGEAYLVVKDGANDSFATIGTYSGNVCNYGGQIFGGGKAGKVQGNKAAGINGNTHLDLSGHVKVVEVYGGGEGVTAQTDYTYVKIHDNANNIEEVYGGGLSGPIIGTIDNNEITVELINAKVTTVFGGGYNAGVAGIINLSIIGNSTVGFVYGGNYESGNIQDSITVTIGEENQATTTTITEALYGAGYNARYYSMGITITINDGSDIAKVYGGGYQADVDVLDGYGTQVHVKGGEVGEVFGGGYAGSVGNKNLVSIEGGVVTNNVYGGGYDGDTVQSDINITDGSIGGNVYGAGYNGSATNTNINITGGQIEKSVFGGGYGQVSSVTNSEIFINLDNTITVEESTESASDTSSISSIELKSETYTDYIKGSVYGGGDMGTIGEGYIDKTSNTARVDVTGSTKITIENGHIGGSVFGGGNGEPPVGTAYNLNMGTVFGYTEVNIHGGRIAGSVFGGGNQSRTYAPLNGSGVAGVATTVNIKEEVAALGNTAKVIFIGDNTVSGSGSIFGGGNTTSTGVGTATNASIPTTIGDTNVNIQGLIIDNGNTIEGSLIYILGGVYGDGNLCLVNGTRNVTMKDFSTGTDDGKLKTFFSLQRADKVLLDNTQVVLKGAIDLVEVGDDTEYSINRVGDIEMTNGSTFKLTTVVKYLGAVSSDYAHGAMTKDRNYKTNILTDDEIDAYREENPYDHNTICVANGLYLELMNEDDTLGYVEGLFTLSLLIATPGEGGGFVYASNESTQQGDFICMTKFSIANDAVYMEIIDGTCLRNSIITRYWYIAGSSIHYGVNLNGYIGTSEVEFIQEVILPTNKVTDGNEIYFVLQQIKVSDTKLSSALKANTYILVNEIPAEGLKEQEIAIELRIVESTSASVPTSVGFLQYSKSLDDWSIYSNSKNIYGKVSNNQVDKTDIANVIGNAYDPTKTYNLQLVLHKSSSVNTEITNAKFNFNFEIMEGNNTSLAAISNGTTDLHFDVVMNIVRLIPVQSSYGSPGKQYGGVSSSEGIKITEGSSLTINTITRYFPSSYVTADGGNTAFRWQLMAGSVQTYYSKSTGRYAYVYNGTVVGCEGGNPNHYKIVGDVCNYDPDGDLNVDEVLIRYTNISAGTDNFFPQGTKITMIDMCNTSNIGYYYYEVTSSDKSIIDIVSEFKVIGSNLPLSNAEVLEDAAFYQQYVNNLKTNVRVTENLVFVFDFSKADTPDSYNGNIIMAHNYGSIDQNTKEFTNRIDIMDYITANIDKTDVDDDNYIMGKSNYCEYEISATEVNVKVEAETPKDTQENFKDFDIYVDIDENTGWMDTDYVDNKYSVVVNYQNSEGVNQIMPVGMHIEFRGNKYYPERDGTFIVVPVETPGRHTLTIVSNLSGYDDANKFNLHIYSSADGEYYNNIDTGIKKDIELNVTPRVGTSLNITVDKQIVKSKENLIVNVKSDAQDLITFDVYKKDANGNFTIPATIFNDLENIALREIDAEGFYHKTFELTEEVPVGTYVLIFNNGTAHTERVYIVVTDEEFLTN